jgi:hypothetical protein
MAYVFKNSRDSWTVQAKLERSSGSLDDAFGYSVAIDGDDAIVGALYDDASGTNSGAAYVFTRSGETWTQQARLLGDGGKTSWDGYGSTVSINGDYAIVGAPHNDEKGSNTEAGYIMNDTGAVYIFKRSGTTWTQQAKLFASNPGDADSFGGAVAIRGDFAVIGANGDDDRGGDAGAAYVFMREGDSWTERAKLLPDPGGAALFGSSVSMDDDRAIVGAYQDSGEFPRGGAAYIYD